jgi:hypothetical protein
MGAAAGVDQDIGRRSRILREHRDDAARGIAVERRERPAQDLDALGRQEAEAPGLPLAVGHRHRDAVLVEP